MIRTTYHYHVPRGKREVAVKAPFPWYLVAYGILSLCLAATVLSFYI